MWQDYVLAGGTIVFNIALIPAIKGTDKPPFLTSIPTALVLYIFSFSFASLQLWFSASMQFIAALL